MKILITDDSRTGRNYIHKTLVISGVKEENIFSAKNGQEALDFILKEKIEMVFLDLNMPVLNGFQVIERLENLELLKNITIIITSSLSDDYHLNKLRSHGIKHFLKKPFTPEALNSVYQILRKE